MNIMNRINKLFMMCLLYALTALYGNAQVFNENEDLLLYPITSDQIEDYNGATYLIDFSFSRSTIQEQCFSQFEYKGNVKAMTITHYSQIEVWDKKEWKKVETYRVSVTDSSIILNNRLIIAMQYDAYEKGPYVYTMLNARGKDSKTRYGGTATYQRDNLGRVEQITIKKRSTMQIYRYSYVGSSHNISKLEKFNESAKREVEVNYQYEGGKIVSAKCSFYNGVKSKEYLFTYNKNNDISKAVLSEIDEFGGKRRNYYFSYEYSNGKIDTCSLQVGDSDDSYNKYKWSFKYDSYGNWIERVEQQVNGTERITRQISYN